MFYEVDDAIQFLDGLSGRAIKYSKRDGNEGQVGPFRPCPSHIKRRGTALHQVHEVLEARVLAAEEQTKQVHRTRGPQPYMLYYAMHFRTEQVRLMATVSWSDSGVKVTINHFVPEPDIQDEAKAALRGLLGAPAP